METVLRLGTRGSRLALAQARLVAQALSRAQPACRVEIVVVRTTGDAVLDRPLHEVGGKGAFTRELELALLDRRIDVAVHSCKDVPVTEPLINVDELVLACFPPREQACDVLVWPGANVPATGTTSASTTSRGAPYAGSGKPPAGSTSASTLKSGKPRTGKPADSSTSASTLDALPRGARVGTSSPRRAAMLLELRPDLRVLAVRGNIDTRLARLDAGECEALLLAKAGLLRAGLLDPTRMRDLPVEQFVPAAGQGALALQCRRDDATTIALLAAIDCPTTRRCVELERAVVRELQGDCHSAIGVHAQTRDAELLVLAALGVERGVKRARASVTTREPIDASAARIARMLRDG